MTDIPERLSQYALRLLGIAPMSLISMTAEERKAKIIDAAKRKAKIESDTASKWEELLGKIPALDEKARTEIDLLYQAVGKSSSFCDNYDSFLESQAVKRHPSIEDLRSRAPHSYRQTIAQRNYEDLKQLFIDRNGMNLDALREPIFNRWDKLDNSDQREEIRPALKQFYMDLITALNARYDSKSIEARHYLKSIKVYQEELIQYGLQGEDINALTEKANVVHVKMIVSGYQSIQNKASESVKLISSIKNPDLKTEAMALVKRAIDTYKAQHMMSIDAQFNTSHEGLAGQIKENHAEFRRLCAEYLYDQELEPFKAPYIQARKACAETFEPSIKLFKQNARWWQTGLVSYIPWIATWRAGTWKERVATKQSELETDLTTQHLKTFSAYLEHNHRDKFKQVPDDQSINDLMFILLHSSIQDIPTQFRGCFDLIKRCEQQIEFSKQNRDIAIDNLIAECTALDNYLASAKGMPDQNTSENDTPSQGEGVKIIESTGFNP